VAEFSSRDPGLAERRNQRRSIRRGTIHATCERDSPEGTGTQRGIGQAAVHLPTQVQAPIAADSKDRIEKARTKTKKPATIIGRQLA